MTKIFKDGTSQLPQVRCPNCNKLSGNLKRCMKLNASDVNGLYRENLLPFFVKKKNRQKKRTFNAIC